MRPAKTKASKTFQAFDSVSLGNRIRIVRAEKNLTLREVAKVAEVSYGTVQRLENGESTVQLDIILRVLNVMQIGLKDYIVDEAGPPQEESVDDLVSKLKGQGKIPELLTALAKQWPLSPKKL